MLRITLFSFVLVACGGEDPLSSPRFDPPLEEPTTIQEKAGEIPEGYDATVPYISRYTPSQGLVGTRVRILGVFSRVLSETTVTIGGAAARVLDNEHLLEVEVPADARTGPLCATVAGRTACAGEFTVLTGPLLYSISPTSVFVGSTETALTVYGDGFTVDSAIYLNSSRLTTRLASVNLLHATVAARFLETAGNLEISVITQRGLPGQGWSEAALLSVENPGPGIDRIEPSIVPAAFCGPLLITGRGFVAESVLTVDGVEFGTAFQSPTTMGMRFNASAFSAGEHQVQVRNPAPGGGLSAPVVLVVE